MQLTIGQVFDAKQGLDNVIAEKRPMPLATSFKLRRMRQKLMVEFNTANAQRDELITKHGRPCTAEEAARGGNMMAGAVWVPPETLAAFNADWNAIAVLPVDIDIEPLTQADLRTGAPDEPATGAIDARELVLLGDLVTE